MRPRPVIPARGRAATLAAATVALAAAWLVGGAAPAGAHATLIGTVPATDGMVDAVPDAVELRFDEPVEVVDDAVQVFGPDGERADLGTVETADGGATVRAPPDADAQGTYTVAWRVTSEDSHTLTGSFVFHNGTRTGAVEVDEGGGAATDIASGFGRWLGMAGTLTAVGAATLALLRPRPGSHGRAATTIPTGPTGPNGEGGPLVGTGPSSGTAGGRTPHGAPAAGPATTGPGTAIGTLTATAVAAGARPLAPARPGDGEDTAPAAGDTTSAVLHMLTVGGALAGALGAFVALVGMLAESAGRSMYDALALVTEVAPDSRTGQLALVRVALALGAAVAAASAAWWRRSPVPALVLAAGSLVAASLSGHAWTAPNRAVAVASDLAHLGAVAVWVGGLVALLAVLPLEGRDGRVRLATRFSAVALGAVVVVAISGTVSGWQQVRTLDGLTSTTYGRLLLAKVAGFAVLVVLGWVNRARLVPLVGRTVAPLQRSLRIETLVAAAVLAVAAALIHQPPARTQDTDGPFDTTAVAESPAGEAGVEGRVDATVDPATAGPNDIHLYFYAGSGTEPLAVDAVEVTAATTDMPARRLQVTPVSTNHVTIAGASLPSAGTWTIEVTAVQAGEPLIFTFEVPIA